MDVNKNRYNRVLVNNELMDEYYIEDGIDQGEVWSPILWRIFYDALLTRLNETKEETGYNFYEEKLINREKGETRVLEISINAMAFMDDTTLISKNKIQLTKMIEICHQFFKINDIKANISKYELIKINDKEKEDLIIEGEKISKNKRRKNRHSRNFGEKIHKKQRYFKKKQRHYVLRRPSRSGWYKYVKMETLMQGERIKHEREDSKMEYIGQVTKSNIHINLFDENEKKGKNQIITWNVEGDFPIFCEDKKKSQSKKCKRIGLHLELVNDKIDINNSPFLKKCKGCDRNIDTKKIKPKVDERGKKIYGFKIMWKILEEKNNIIEENSEITLLAKHDGNNENEFKIILRSLIIGLLIIENDSEIVLGINENVQKLIFDFKNNFSNRRKIDSDYYLELLFIENFLEDNEMKIAEMNEYDYRLLKKLRVIAREILNEEINTIKYNFEINNEALLVNEFNLYWNQRLITGGYTRGWRKKVTNAIWKNEMLNSNRLDDLFMYNFKKEFDWKNTLEFISNRTEFSKRQCGDKDTYERFYRIKNLLKEQPTYEALYQRNTNKIEDNKCIRCKENEIESWEHIWICNDNESTLNEIIYDSLNLFEQQLKNSNQEENIEILRNFSFDFLNVLESPSVVLRGKSRIWELIRELWRFTYNEIKNRIWIPRCNEVKRLEEIENIKKADLRKRKNDQEEKLDEDGEKINKKKKKTEEKIEENKNILETNIKLATLTKLTGKIVDGINIDNIWDTTVKIADYID
uniref:Reverse transcriptase domain-containing protein n=2 Tax=Rhizophagus irregularis TaxID=588596 RepID=U9UA15_RHIID